MDEDRYEGSDDEERFERSRLRTAVAPGPPGNQQEHGGEICIREYLDSPVATSTAGTPEGARDRLVGAACNRGSKWFYSGRGAARASTAHRAGSSRFAGDRTRTRPSDASRARYSAEVSPRYEKRFDQMIADATVDC